MRATSRRSPSNGSSGPRKKTCSSSRRKARAFEHVRDRRGRGQPHHARHAVADVVGAGGDLGVARAPVDRWRQPHADARRAGERAHDADEGVGPVDAVVAAKARAEIDDLDRAAARVGQRGDQDRRVALVALRRRRPDRSDRSPRRRADRSAGSSPGEQRAEHRIAIDARHAGPHEARRCGRSARWLRAIADRREIEIAIALMRGSARVRARR